MSSNNKYTIIIKEVQEMKNVFRKVIVPFLVLALVFSFSNVSAAKKSKFTGKIKSIEVKSVKIKNKSSISDLTKGEKSKIEYSISVSVKTKGKVDPKVIKKKKAAASKVSFKSSDDDVLSVESDGSIVAKSTGTVTVKVISKKNKKKLDSVKINVKKVIIPAEKRTDAAFLPTELYFAFNTDDEDDEPSGISLNDYDDRGVAYKILLDGSVTTADNFIFSSDNTSVIDVSETTGDIAVIGTGKATITATLINDLTKKATLVVYVVTDSKLEELIASGEVKEFEVPEDDDDDDFGFDDEEDEDDDEYDDGDEEDDDDDDEDDDEDGDDYDE